MKAKADQVEKNKAVMEEFTKLFFAGDWEKTLNKVIAEDIVLHHPGGEDLHGLPAVIGNWRVAFAPLTDMKVTVLGQASEGNLLATFYAIDCRYVGEVAGKKVDGVPAHFNQVELVRIENGKIVEWWVEIDRLWMMQQLGLDLTWK